MPRPLSYAGVVTAPTDRGGWGGGALGGAFGAHRAVLLRYLRARGAGDAAEDVLQELWLKVRATDAGIDVVDARAYLFRMAHNLLADRRRSEQRRAARDIRYQGAIDGNGLGIDGTPSAERVLLDREALRAVERVLAALGGRTDHIFRRHRIEGAPQRDIADELGISVSAVEKHLQKAYRAVVAARRRLLGDEAASDD